MSRLEITEVQIDNYNETNDRLTKFTSGLNIICGPNEIGKSTLMSFIKNIFLREKNDAKGYLKYSIDGKNVQLGAGKNKIKENEPYLENISPHSYKTGFIIDLDDLIQAKKSDSDELVNTIKDSSGNAVNKKQALYYDYIYGKKQPFSLTGTNKAAKSFVEQFEKLKTIEQQITELEQKEDEYNNICRELENLQKDIQDRNIKYSYAKLLCEKQKVESERNNLNINLKLLENKKEFENIRESFGALNSKKSKVDGINSRLLDCDSNYSQKYNELTRLENIDKETIKDFELSPVNLKLAKQLIENEKEIINNKNMLEQQIKSISEDLDRISGKKESFLEKLSAVGVKNIDDYTNDKILLENYLLNYSGLLDKYRNSGKNTDVDKSGILMLFILIFAGILFACIASLFMFSHQPTVMYMFIAVILASVAGINTCVAEKLKNKKNNMKENLLEEIDTNKNSIVELFNKYKFEYSGERDFTVQTNSIIQKMNNVITGYNSIYDDLTELTEEYAGKTEKLEELQNQTEKLEKEYEIFRAEKDEFLKKVSVSTLENYEPVYEYIRELKSISAEIETLSKSIGETDKDTDEFVLKINDFLRLSGLDSVPAVNKYDDFETVLNEIRNILDKNLENNRLREELAVRIKSMDNEINNYPVSVRENLTGIDDTTLETIKDELKIKQEEKGMLIRSKEMLEQVSGLVELKNKRNTELNRLKSALKHLMVKEVVYNVICSSKEKFNEIQPNLVSAKKYLAKITDNKYNDIDFETRCIRGDNKGDKEWDKLSRGTKEQLYLALRLGFADNYPKDRYGNPNGLPELPLIIDDAFVNFDNSRTAAVLKCLEEFAKNNQVLFFTCHGGNIKEILKRNKTEYNLVEL